MPISHKDKLIFIHIPKNAGTAITNNLNMKDIGHHTWNYYKSKYPKEWRDYTKISVIRNPWDRVVSCYEYAKMDESYWHSSKGPAKAGKHLDYDLLKEKSFNECLGILDKTPKKLRHQGWSDQSRYIFNGDNLMVDHVIKIDEIDEKLLEILGRDIKIPMVNKSNDNDYKTYYKDSDMIDIVGNRYKEDIRVFNFKFDESDSNG